MATAIVERPKEQVASAPTVVVKVLDDKHVVINKGRRDRVELGQKFLIYGIDDEDLVDPVTKESLGHLEIVRGQGIVTHVQDRIATVRSNNVQKLAGGRRIIKRTPAGAALLGIHALSMRAMLEEEVVEIPTESEVMPFEGAEVGDNVRPI
jgi:hypothetical protein